MVVNSAKATSFSWIISKLGSKADSLHLPSNNVNVCGCINTFIKRHVNVVELGSIHTMKRRGEQLSFRYTVYVLNTERTVVSSAGSGRVFSHPHSL